MSVYMVKNSRGFTLLELIVVMVIIAIVSTIATLDFRLYQTKARITAQIREMSDDFNNVRIDAIQKKKAHGINITPTSYTFLRYSSEKDVSSGSGTVVSSKSVKFRITTLAGADLNALVKLDERGYVIGINPPSMAVGLGAGDVPNDCLVMSVTRVNLGKLNGGVCEFK